MATTYSFVRAQEPPSATESIVIPWPPVLVTLSFLIPVEVSLMIGSFRLMAYRIVLLVLLPVIISRMLDRDSRFAWYEFFIIFAAIWIVFSTVFHYGIGQGLESGGMIAIEAIAGYFVFRTGIRSRAELRGYIRVLFLAVAGLVPILAVEAITHQPLIRNIGRMMMGLPAVGLQQEPRWGMMRALGPFYHPIHAGMFLASTCALLFHFLPPARRRLGMVLSGVGTFFTLSSGAYILLILQIGIIGYRWATSIISLTNRWVLFGSALAAMIVFIELASDHGFIRFFISKFTLNPQTGHWRLLIWEYGGAEVMRNPIFGLGITGDWIRPSFMGTPSVDAFWLAISMQYGLPMCLSVLVAVLGICITVGRRASMLDEETRLPLISWIIVIVSISLASLTVHLWHNLFSWYFMLLGLGAALLNIYAAPPLASTRERRPFAS